MTDEPEFIDTADVPEEDVAPIEESSPKNDPVDEPATPAEGG